MPEALVRTDLHPLSSHDWRQHCRTQLNQQGALVLPDFLQPAALQAIVAEGDTQRHRAYHTQSKHNVYLMKADPDFSDTHPRNREVSSTKGCITDDVIAPDSPLRQLYDDALFQSFLCEVLEEEALYPYADPLSSINLHYAPHGKELGWHFDNSSFAITLLVQKPVGGGRFQYVKDLRNADAGEMNYAGVAAVLDEQQPVDELAIEAGDLVLFRGRNSLHRVTPTEGDVTRLLAVLAYNTAPGIALSETARMTFYGRL
ncbi:2OG-Fe(II) oxygenase family protein [Pantoea allii]|uniref:2OG-Fe(II) oxygenase family protein n=1 Tax=Pantoea allii TaxID=574096 RepID=A0ABS6VK21_9GAMM|nr:2OG-Fe(II) oxygenase family protein [Pantoea allii]MBW1213863.1 2OG-Fe(II) oxygenase family protein [Pantoea allii]MBW1259676.1 2OG-Fe(II) oxygenase family protein [Pantoea allii]MBW1268849.1 2OG-Fe(II) oxygenase family protein [Pantoea allii]MBW1290878.1 2OG-Fe(II) oxygenase family protein [Pantoea allii]